MITYDVLPLHPNYFFINYVNISFLEYAFPICILNLFEPVSLMFFLD